METQKIKELKNRLCGGSNRLRYFSKAIITIVDEDTGYEDIDTYGIYVVDYGRSLSIGLHNNEFPLNDRILSYLHLAGFKKELKEILGVKTSNCKPNVKVGDKVRMNELPNHIMNPDSSDANFFGHKKGDVGVVREIDSGGIIVEVEGRISTSCYSPSVFWPYDMISMSKITKEGEHVVIKPAYTNLPIGYTMKYNPTDKRWHIGCKKVKLADVKRVAKIALDAANCITESEIIEYNKQF